MSESGREITLADSRQTDRNSGEELTRMTCDVSCEYVHSFAEANSLRTRGAMIPLFTDSNSVFGLNIRPAQYPDQGLES